MANSDFDLTRDQIITAAIRKLGAIPSGGSATNDQLSDGSTALNAMVKAWQNLGIRLWTAEWTYLAMNAGTSIYYPDPILSIQEAFLRRDDIDYPVDIGNINEFMQISDKTDTGMPGIIAFKYDKASPEIHVWPTPENSTDVLHFLQIRKLQDFDATGDKPDLPSRWINALIWGLAAELAPEYSVTVDVQDRLVSRSNFWLEAAIRGERSQAPSMGDFIKSAY